jgi:hypothetical protein
VQIGEEAKDDDDDEDALSLDGIDYGDDKVGDMYISIYIYIYVYIYDVTEHIATTFLNCPSLTVLLVGFCVVNACSFLALCYTCSNHDSAIPRLGFGYAFGFGFGLRQMTKMPRPIPSMHPKLKPTLKPYPRPKGI